MESEIALDLLLRFLEKRAVKDIDLKKELTGLVAFGKDQGCFKDPGALFQVEAWRECGDLLWNKVIDGDKRAKKLLKPWRAVINCLKQYQTEEKIAAVASSYLRGVGTEKEAGKLQLGVDYVPTPPTGCPVSVKPLIASASGGGGPSAPQLEEHNGEGRLPENAEEELKRETAETHKNELIVKSDTNREEKLSKSSAGVLRLNWQEISRTAIEKGDHDLLSVMQESCAFPVFFEVTDQGARGEYSPLDWKLLSQLRATVNESGLHSEPTRQMLNYIWGSGILCPEDVKTLVRMIMTQSQLMLWQAHWNRLCDRAVNIPRGQQDPLHGVTVEHLMGVGPFATVDMQVQLGPAVLREPMRLARVAISMVKTAPPTPSYMSIKQGREESFASFVDRVTDAIDRSDAQEWMKGALLRQCIMENCDAATRAIIVTLPGDASVEEMLDRMSKVPVGPQAMLVDAVKDLGNNLVQAQSQVLAALASLPQNRSSGRPPGTAARGHQQQFM
ncbi:uncharacterized protein LOC127395181 isoform X1 [Apus apus]|uniref:uncharacterized protein LOC127395181 isoform X1 n=1 Tax=Apus apus TaxID=8895 RepID=UPI0021F81EE9|nr:uncharacterized protein LOC127395181 isoform X1 [Apus apus]XP_051497693.1 uncharacterized protein LOC127395181 isoform X1 [Apus apus]XP_051497694.1 uncharacterized protein LOC127395181 isoform X1 [Apus apus]XP_051497695.1 uncharacterized protein LOC127395181 isoform X1 [Apus apus]